MPSPETIPTFSDLLGMIDNALTAPELESWAGAHGDDGVVYDEAVFLARYVVLLCDKSPESIEVDMERGLFKVPTLVQHENGEHERGFQLYRFCPLVLVDTKAAAQAAGVHPRTIYHWREQGLASIKVDGRIYFERDKLVDEITRRGHVSEA